ncbi:MAG: HK97 gp10 family phage protein [Clostridia bacterium]|nr:HK97 gp10 family phage protein [Clostridia bacterium]
MEDNIEIEVDLTEFTKGIKKVSEAEVYALMQAARSIGGEAAGFAKENCPVDTGLLRNSIVFALSGGGKKKACK